MDLDLGGLDVSWTDVFLVGLMRQRFLLRYLVLWVFYVAVVLC